MKLPAFLFRLLPLWSYICPRCRREVKRNSHKCPFCGEKYEKPLKVPPCFLKSKEALEEYVHKHIFPRIPAKQREYLAQFFTEFFSDGFESGDFSAWDSTTGSPSVQSSVVNSGSYAMSATGTSNVYAQKTFTDQTIVYIRFYARWTALDDTADGTRPLRVLGNDGSSGLFVVRVQTSGISFYNVYGTNIGWHKYSTTMNTNQWHCIEVKIKGGSDGEYRLWLDGTEVITLTGQDNSGMPDVDAIQVGLTKYSVTSTTVYIDDVVVADTYIGPIGETTEVQVSDSAAGTETISRPYRFFNLTDAAFGQEVMLKTRNLSLSDVAIGLEILRKARDIGTITDTAQGLEQILKQRLIKLLDQAAGSETIARPTRIIIMVDEALSQEIIGKLREIADITDSAIGMEYISAGKVGESIKTKIFLFIGDLAIQVTGD